ncbi:MAG: hypothetical protein ACLP7Q_02155 [Isosphaeraceae bacterium]
MKATSHEAAGHELPGHGRQFHVLNRCRLILVWAVWVTGTVALFLFVRHYARNVPFNDDWWMVPVITGHEPISLRWAWFQHAEHRMPVPKLIQASLLRWLVPDFRAGMYLNAGLLSLAAATMIVLARRLRGQVRLTDSVLPLSILTLAQYDVLLIGFALNLVLTTWLSYVLIAVLGRVTERPPWLSVIPIGISLVLLPLCGGSGLAMLPPLVLWLVGYLCCGWWSGREPGTWARAFGVLCLMACSALVALYLCSYIQMRPPVPSLRAMVRTSLECLSLSLLCSGSVGYWKVAAVTVVAMIAAALVRLIVVAVRLPHERPRAIGLAAVILSTIAVAIAVGKASAGFGPGAGLTSRYVTLATPLLSALYVSWLIYTPAWRRWALQTCVFLVVCISVPGLVKAARNTAEPRLQGFRLAERGLKAGKPDAQILDVACPTFQPPRIWTSEWIKMLRSSGFGNFKYLDEAQIAITSKPETTHR